MRRSAGVAALPLPKPPAVWLCSSSQQGEGSVSPLETEPALWLALAGTWGECANFEPRCQEVLYAPSSLLLGALSLPREQAWLSPRGDTLELSHFGYLSRGPRHDDKADPQITADAWESPTELGTAGLLAAQPSPAQPGLLTHRMASEINDSFLRH